eukprot:scaffold407_cov251-Pinguiococcus_pyrenoidosus.AAC.33
MSHSVRHLHHSDGANQQPGKQVPVALPAKQKAPWSEPYFPYLPVVTRSRKVAESNFDFWREPLLWCGGALCLILQNSIEFPPSDPSQRRRRSHLRRFRRKRCGQMTPAVALFFDVLADLYFPVPRCLVAWLAFVNIVGSTGAQASGWQGILSKCGSGKPTANDERLRHPSVLAIGTESKASLASGETRLSCLD